MLKDNVKPSDTSTVRHYTLWSLCSMYRRSSPSGIGCMWWWSGPLSWESQPLKCHNTEEQIQVSTTLCSFNSRNHKLTLRTFIFWSARITLEWKFGYDMNNLFFLITEGFRGKLTQLWLNDKNIKDIVLVGWRHRAIVKLILTGSILMIKVYQLKSAGCFHEVPWLAPNFTEKAARHNMNLL